MVDKNPHKSSFILNLRKLYHVTSGIVPRGLEVQVFTTNFGKWSYAVITFMLDFPSRYHGGRITL